MKADQAQTVQRVKVESECLENELMTIKSSRTHAAQAVLEFKRQLQAASKQIDQKADEQKDRIEFLNKTIESSEKEKEKLRARLHQLEIEVVTQKDKYEHQMESMQFQYQEVEANLKGKISAALHHLRGLREFQEHKHQLEEQMRTVSHMLVAERKDRTAELTAIHRKLVAQREFYEKQLAQQLGDAEAFATQFSDLHLDLATTKILGETEKKKEDLKRENNQTAEVLKHNNQLRHQIQELEQQESILGSSEKSLTSQAVDLKTKVEDTTKKMNEANKLYQEKLSKLTESINEKTAQLLKRLSDDKEANESLKKQVALAQKNLSKAEAAKEEKMRKQQDLLCVMNEAAIFVLTSLELQEKDPTKDAIVSHSSGLNAVIRKLENVSQDLSGIQQKKSDTKMDEKAAQTEKVPKKFLSSGRPSPEAVANFLKSKKIVKKAV